MKPELEERSRGTVRCEMRGLCYIARHGDEDDTDGANARSIDEEFSCGRMH
jgi:hypothetical protein